MRTRDLFVLLPAAALSFLACGPGGGGGASAPVPVRTGLAERRDVADALRAVGTVVPVESAAVRAQVTGPVSEVLFSEGQTVRAGQPLFQIDPRPFRTALGQADARLARSRAELAHAQAQARRLDDLESQGFVSAQEAEAARTAAASLAASVQEAQESQAASALSLDYATVRAPISGRAGSAQVKKGNSVKSNEAVLVEIHQLDPIEVAFGVPGEALGPVRAAAAAGRALVEATVPGVAEPVRGELVFVDNAVSPGTGTLRLKGRFPNGSGTLWPGQVVDVTLTVGVEEGVVAVPVAAVLEGQQGAYAYVVRDGKALRRPLEVGRSQGGWTVVESGVEAGETVVTDGQLRLSEGSPVQLQGDLPAKTP